MRRFSLFVFLPAVAQLMATTSLQGDEASKPRRRASRPESKESRLSEEPAIFAETLKGLDQSYSFRGMQGDGSFTAGSISIDWQAKGVDPPQGILITPPTPRVFSRGSGRKTGLSISDAAALHRADEVSPPRRDHALVGMPPRLVPIRADDIRPSFELSFCIDLMESNGPEALPVLRVGECVETSPLIVDQYRGDLRLRFRTDMPDQFDSEVHEVSLGRFCGTRRFKIHYVPGRLIIAVDGQSFAIDGIQGDFVAGAVDCDDVQVNQRDWHDRLGRIHWECVR